MEQYELTLLFRVRDYENSCDAARGLIHKLSGEIAKEEDMGERQLAYPVRKEEHGHYLYLAIRLESGSVAALKDGLQAHNSVLKYLLVKE